MSAQSHRSDPRILSRRTLERDHKRLAQVLRPGMAVLDVGCGTGAITAGIAKAVGSSGSVVGVDRDESLLEVAREEYRDIPNLIFETGDALTLRFESCFDIVTAARTLQWTSQPEVAVHRMKKATRPRSRVLVLDYNHDANSWEPEPPAEFRRFYRAFLDWRAANRWDNRITENLPGLFQAAGLTGIQTHVSDEIVQRGDPDFDRSAGIWSHVMETIGPKIVAAGFLSESDLYSAEGCYPEWMERSLEKQILSMRTIEGQKSES